MAKKQKFYAVWTGRKPGIYTSWDECKKQVEGFDGAQYKSFESKTEAENALKRNYYAVVNPSTKQASNGKLIKIPKPKHEALVVDAAWNTKTGDMEYQGKYLQNKLFVFKKGPFQDGTNNIGEFLAIVHALAFLKQHNSDLPIYSDSKTAIAWVKKKKANTKLEPTGRNDELFDLLERAEKWLRDNNFSNKILKWETEDWGENPADFGRK
ncbi:MAG: ribonuclease H family protein [Cytophagaceae bacterium]|nr:ribonuclease H family protein [Cytophagaceae bacterium]MBK9933121.1 ribonuclease H family protein [Cytophagaceae bacterium]MBL0303163.1 ribonuclease H family protein [Cytophagaceae bacterium]MBL0326010.1 ribonuclease H family protein [Cytophagaceae bacterium]